MQNPHCYFSMDGPIGSFSPVQGALGAYGQKLHYDANTVKTDPLIRFA